MLQRHEIRVLLRAGHSQRDVAARTGTSADTVRRVKRESAVSETDDAAERRSRGIGRPSKAAPFAVQVTKWLADEPELPTQELLRRAKESGYAGNKTAFYAMVAGARPSRVVPIVRSEGLPGEFSQHDFGHVDVRFVDGRKKRVHFFASRLKYGVYATSADVQAIVALDSSGTLLQFLVVGLARRSRASLSVDISRAKHRGSPRSSSCI